MLYQQTIPPFIKALKNLDRILDKGQSYAETKKFDVEVLLNARLAPDQFPLLKQVQIVCDTAKLAASRLTGKPAPVDEDAEKTLPELKSRIARVIDYLQTFSESDFQNAAAVKVTQPRWEGKYLLGSDYVAQHAIPNLYFHVTTAYSILRHNGVDVGKKDYLGELGFKS